MADERYGRGTGSGRDDYGRDEAGDSRRDYGSDRDYSRSSARDYGAGEQGGRYGAQDYGQRDAGRQDWGQQGSVQQDYGYQRYGQRDRTSGQGQGNGQQGFTGGRDYYRGGDNRGVDTYRQGRGTDDRQPQGHDDDRGFVQRAGDEVRSWFGDEDAERRREMDARRDDQTGGRHPGDDHYHSWRSQQMEALDRDYHEYRQHNQAKFHNEFSSWRTSRQGQRDLLNRVEEHADVVGSDGEHVGTVDKVRGDRVILTKSDADAGGRHHSFASGWLQSVDGNKVMLNKTAADAKRQWRDEERSGAMSGDQQRTAGDRSGQRDAGDQSNDGQSGLNRSFSGTY